MSCFVLCLPGPPLNGVIIQAGGTGTSLVIFQHNCPAHRTAATLIADTLNRLIFNPSPGMFVYVNKPWIEILAVTQNKISALYFLCDPIWMGQRCDIDRD